MRPEAPIGAADLWWALASLCGVQRVPFDARLVLQQFPPPLDVAALVHAANALGLRASLGAAQAALRPALRSSSLAKLSSDSRCA